MSQVSRYKKAIVKWVKQNRAIIVAALLFVLCLGMIDTVVSMINNTLVHLTSFGSNRYLDWLFIIISLAVAVYLIERWICVNRIVSPQFTGMVLFIESLYAYFRLADRSRFVFTNYWDGCISYLDIFALLGLSIIGLFVFQQFRKAADTIKDEKYNFSNDRPINKSDEDLFNMGNLVSRIVYFIANTDVEKKAFSIGIVGEWGDGKSSLLNLIEEKLGTDYKEFIVVHFNPRASKSANYIQEDFLDALKVSLAPFHSGINRIIDDYSVALDAISGIPSFASRFLGLLKIYLKKNQKSKKDILSQAIVDIRRRIVILIDDLDRLTGEELLEVLKVIDTNGAFPNTVFLTAFDKTYVNRVLENHLRLGLQPRPYTDKYFTVEVPVPLHPSFRLINHLVSILRKACDSGYISQHSASEIERLTKSLSSYLSLRLLTIRDIRRFANQFLYDYAEIQRDVNFQDYLLLELVKFSYPEEYNAIHRYHYIHRASSSVLNFKSKELIYLNKELSPQKTPDGKTVEPKNPPRCLDILRRLFPKEDEFHNWYLKRNRRLYSVSSFEHYFYNYEYSHLKASDVDELLGADSLERGCKVIDGWKKNPLDVETFFLTYILSSIRDKDVLKKYLQYLLYSSGVLSSSNCTIHSYQFIRKEEVDQFIESCGFANLKEYIDWLKDGLNELFFITPEVVSAFIRHAITGLFEQNSTPELFIFTAKELQEYATELLKSYLARIEDNTWSATSALEMAHIQEDESKDYLSGPLEFIHDSMVDHFERYSSSLPFVVEQNGRCHAGFILSFLFWGTFKEKDEFEVIINEERYSNAPSINIIKAIWPVYKLNGYQNFTLPKRIHSKNAMAFLLNEASKEFAPYTEICNRIDELENEWEDSPRISKLDSLVSKSNELFKALQDIGWWLMPKDTYSERLNNLNARFKEYSITARRLDKESLRRGDFVRMKNELYNKYLVEYPDKLIYQENIFRVSNISDSGQIMTAESSIPLSFDDIEAVLIDGLEDRVVYYDPVIMASYVAPGQPVPVHHQDKSYYMEHFKRCFDINKKAFTDCVAERGFQFVHEVQHWLRDEMQDEGLKLNHSFREGI